MINYTVCTFIIISWAILGSILQNKSNLSFGFISETSKRMMPTVEKWKWIEVDFECEAKRSSLYRFFSIERTFGADPGNCCTASMKSSECHDSPIKSVQRDNQEGSESAKFLFTSNPESRYSPRTRKNSLWNPTR